MNGTAQAKNAETATLVPLERELRNSVRRREVLEQLMDGLGQVNRILMSGLDQQRFAAYGALKKSFLAAIGVVKNFRG
ncbi:MAG: hypothetical protein LBH53_00225 [Puniceicoccales bacterium]|jgi:hypothetical protein|nr:hypothetical protein [Puniceicoccales bacterium]